MTLGEAEGVSCFDEKLPLAMRLPLSGTTVLSLAQAIAGLGLNLPCESKPDRVAAGERDPAPIEATTKHL